MNQTIRNERRKLLAMWSNNFSIAVLVAGFLTPIWTIIYGTTQPQSGDLTRIVGPWVVWKNRTFGAAGGIDR